ncbi:hypothetical protein IFM89_024757 [Coptis chinensis]|uniref:Reverse transcriptase zinc-binding domain-containing protein n=1 Tax=Coptis chinensis TaxID=261450 RepID=A0A835GXQ3_9MAGN|nr:hypothetical protein IFM89_024757 [Coptis chinensis]
MLHPRTSALVWKLMNDSSATGEKVQRRGIALAPGCYVCKKKSESLHHILWSCPFAEQLWRWIASRFKSRLNIQKFQSATGAIKKGSTILEDVMAVCYHWRHGELMAA